MNLRHREPAVVGSLLAAALLIAGCSSSDTASSTASSAASSTASSAASSAVPSPESTVASGNVAITAAACGEITRLSRDELDGFADASAAHWGRFAVGLQAVADGSADPDFGAAVTAMATAALRASDTLRADKPLGPALTSFEDTIPAVDAFCKRVAAPLN